MSLNESIVEDASLEWFLLRPIRQAQDYGGQVGKLVPQPREVRHGVAFAGLRRAKLSLAPGEPAAERASFSEVVLLGRLREALRRLNLAMPEEASACADHAHRRATSKHYLQVQIDRRTNP